MHHLYNDSSSKDRRRQLRRHQTDAEKKIWHHIRNRQLFGKKFLRQYGVGPYILDFYCPSERLGIELDGSQHFEVTHVQYDKWRTDFLHQQNIRIIRFGNIDVLKNTESVLEVIAQHLTPSNSPLYKGENNATK